MPSHGRSKWKEMDLNGNTWKNALGISAALLFVIIYPRPVLSPSLTVRWEENSGSREALMDVWVNGPPLEKNHRWQSCSQPRKQFRNLRYYTQECLRLSKNVCSLFYKYSNKSPMYMMFYIEVIHWKFAIFYFIQVFLCFKFYNQMRGKMVFKNILT